MLEAGVHQFGEWGNTGTSLENVGSQLRSLRHSQREELGNNIL
jgi:hypothetical protein